MGNLVSDSRRREYDQRTKERIPNKVLWGLMEAIALSMKCEATWQRCFALAKATQNIELIIALGQLRDELGRLERTARNASNGRYEE